MSAERDGDNFHAVYRAFRQPPASRQAPEDKPLVYGYVRNSNQRPAIVERDAELLSEWCENEGWHLGVVFRDIAVSSNSLVRPGFTGLLDVLSLPNSYAVVIVDPVHLSRKASVIRQLSRQIRATGARLLILNDELPLDGGVNDAGTRTRKGIL